MTEYRAEDLDGERLAALLLSIPLASSSLRHTSLQSSLGYIHPGEDDMEMQYVHDFLTLGTQAIIDKWFGGSMVAGRTSAGLTESWLRQLQLLPKR